MFGAFPNYGFINSIDPKDIFQSIKEETKVFPKEVANNDLANGEIFHVTDGKTYSTREIYESMCFVLNKSVPNWIMPKIIFDIVSKFSPYFKNKIDKLLGDELYSSKKIESIGFKPKFTMKDMNEKIF